MVNKGICARCRRVAGHCLGQLELGLPTAISAEPALPADERPGCLKACRPFAILAWVATVAAVALASLIDSLIRARRLRRQRTLCDLAALSWQQFEEVVADAFRRHD
jgi:hypothetical protein